VHFFAMRLRCHFDNRAVTDPEGAIPDQFGTNQQVSLYQNGKCELPYGLEHGFTIAHAELTEDGLLMNLRFTLPSAANCT